jgi:outer membrane receptor protein involved in Fe transport
MTRSFLVRALLSTFAFILIAGVAAADAQTSRGTVSGTITDPNGAVIEGAAVDLVNKATNTKRSATTNSSGFYRFDAVDPGTYDIVISQQGFKKVTIPAVQVSANLTSERSLQLEIGSESVVVEVTSGATDVLQTTEPVKGGNFTTRQIQNLPSANLNPYDFARLLPGVVTATGGAQFGNASQFSINGSRPRGNNYLIDGTENNDISVTGPAAQINNEDAVAEVSVQTGLFSAEFGRAGGGVFNLITKSGTNEFHGSLRWLNLNQAFNAYSNTDGLNNLQKKGVFTENVFGGTIGGPLPLPNFGEGGKIVHSGKDRTFFFFGLQYDRFRSTTNFGPFRVPTQNGFNTLRALFPAGSNPRVDLYLAAIGNARGTTTLQTIDLGTGPNGAGVTVARGLVETGNTTIGAAAFSNDRQWVLRVDHRINSNHQLSFRYTDDIFVQPRAAMNSPGFTRDFRGPTRNFLATHTWVINSSWTNELRISPYGLIDFDFPISPDAPALAFTLPAITIANLSQIGINTNIPQGRRAKNYLVQDTMTWVTGKHTFRYGFEVLKQTAFQRQPFNSRGSFGITTGGGFTGLANFIDNFSGPSGSANKNIGEPGYRPNLLRHSYFFQDTWRTTQDLTLTLGLRYENFGQPANNAFQFPAFAGTDPALFLVPNKVKVDNNNFGPIFGFAYSPAAKGGIGGFLFGEKKSSIRGGYQISYDTFFNNMLSNIAADSPNRPSVTLAGSASGRGTANWFPDALNFTFTPGPLNSQTSVFDPNIRNPYLQRFSLGIQRELPGGFFLDTSYVGSVGRKLFVTETINANAAAARRYPQLGLRRIRTSGANSEYHSGQLRVDKRLAKGFTMTASYTWSKLMDQVSEIFATDTSASSLAVVFPYLGGLKLDRAPSDYDREHRLVLSYLWSIPGPKSGFLGHVLGGWQVTGITTFQSGAPFTLVNGLDRNGDGDNVDRPNVGNPNAPRNSRGVIVPVATCASGLRNPETATCVTRNDVFVYQVAANTGFPDSSMIGRNTERSNWVNNSDMSFFKIFPITETWKIQYRVDTYNTFNHPQYTGVPARSMASAAGAYYNFLQNGAGGRTMRMSLKIMF